MEYKSVVVAKIDEKYNETIPSICNFLSKSKENERINNSVVALINEQIIYVFIYLNNLKCRLTKKPISKLNVKENNMHIIKDKKVLIKKNSFIKVIKLNGVKLKRYKSSCAIINIKDAINTNITKSSFRIKSPWLLLE